MTLATSRRSSRALANTCSECGGPVKGKALTCSPAHRKARSRRLRSAAKGEIQSIHEWLDKAPKDVQEELTKQGLEALKSLAAMRPTALAAIQADLESEDAAIRQKAYELWFRYVGNLRITHGSEESGPPTLNVNFGVPRPSDTDLQPPEDAVIEAVEMRTCDICRQEKPAREFVANSERCNQCQHELAERVRARFQIGDGS